MAEGFYGFQSSPESSSKFDATAFLVRAMLSGVCTATLAKVQAVTNSGGVSAIGTVDLQPLVNLLDGDNQSTPHGTIYACPYMRIQGGTNAVILDPQVGDIGIVVFADRDISAVAATKGQANPGSLRRFNWADAMYLGMGLGSVPAQYVQFATAGITIHSPTAVVLSAPDVQINCATLEIAATTSATITTPTLTINGAATVTGDLSASGTSLHTHVHSGVTAGGGNTGTPV